MPPAGIDLQVGLLPALADLGCPGLERLANLRSQPRFNGLDPQPARDVRSENPAGQAESALQ